MSRWCISRSGFFASTLVGYWIDREVSFLTHGFRREDDSPTIGPNALKHSRLAGNSFLDGSPTELNTRARSVSSPASARVGDLKISSFKLGAHLTSSQSSVTDHWKSRNRELRLGNAGSQLNEAWPGRPRRFLAYFETTKWRLERVVDTFWKTLNAIVLWRWQYKCSANEQRKSQFEDKQELMRNFLTAATIHSNFWQEIETFAISYRT